MQVKDLQLKRALHAALLVLLLLAGMESYAERVTPEVARTVAATFLNNNGVRSNQLTDLSERAGFRNLYIFNGEQGFVVMAADDRAKPILGYSLTGRFVAENMPENLRWWLQGYDDEIQYAIDNQVRASAEAAQEWEELENGNSNRTIITTVVPPLISTEWGQGEPYNLQCPTGSLTGCVATAMAQIMKYHNHPSNGTGTHSYNWNGQTLNADFGGTTYQWNKMINSYANGAGTQEQKDAVATLMYHCGVSVDMNYNVDNSGESEAIVNDAVYALQAYFDYDECEFLPKNDYQEYWADWLKDELDAGRPLLYYGDGSGSHAFVCDGYDNGNNFHFNWGWGRDGFCDDYYALEALFPMSTDPNNDTIYGNFTNNQGAIFGIQPSEHNCDAPTNCIAHYINDRNVLVDWDHSSSGSYRVYRDGILIEEATTASNFTDRLVKIGTHRYFVKSNCPDGSISPASNVAEVQFIATIGNLKYSLDERTLTAKVLGPKSGYTSGDLTIPTTVAHTIIYPMETLTYTVTSIGNYAFNGCNGFTGSLTIPNSVISIGNFAFRGCSGFTGSLTIPNSVTRIGDDAFSGCSGFTGHLTIGNSVTSIGEYTFNGCNGFIGDLTIGNSVTSIGNYAFNGCSGFNGSLTIPNSVTSLGQYAFSGCGFNGLEIDMTSIPDQAFNNYHSGGDYSNFTGSLTIGNSVTSIGEDAFEGCSGFTGSLTIPNSVTSIGSSAFSGCSGFTGSLTIGNSVTSIGYSAFSGCSGFTGSLTIGNSVTSIGYSAFSGCSGFTGNLIIPNSVTSISDYAFYGCSGFTGSLAIPNSATSIGKSSFYDCSGFTGSLTIPNSVTSIGVDAFRECSGFTGNLTIPNSVTSLGGHAFYGCGFSGLDINMTNIPDGAFYECSGITGNLTIGNSVTSIGYRAFSGCSGFTGSLTIPNSVTNIESYAFYGCSGFTGGLTIPNSVADLGWSTFEGCSGFTGGLIIPNSVTDLGFRTFEGCSGFTGSLVISNSVTSIREGTFRNCSGFTGDLTIPDAVTYINEEAFAGCSGFTGNLIIPNSVTYIYEGAFKNCSGFTGDLTIPNAITHLNESVFQGCSGLTGDVIIPDGIISIRANAFDGCSGLSGDLSIPHSVTSIGENAFASCSSLTSIHSYGAVPPATCSNAFTNMDFSIPVYVPLCSASDYGETEPWSNFTNYQAALPCPYTFTGNGSDNLWSNPENWHTMPTNDYDIIINANCEMDEDVEASGVIINNTGTLVIKSGHVLTIRENRTRSDEALNGEIVNRGNTTNLIIEDDGQLVYGKGGLLGTVKKDIAPFTLNGNDGWHLLSSPVVGSKTIGWIDNMLSNEYDLYYYDEPTHYWKNYKNPENGFNKLEATQGYLYANSGTITPTGSRVGNGKSSSEHVPFYTLYNYSISEILFRASELEAAGLSTSSLGSLCWYATNATGYEQNGINIWMANVNDEGLTETSHNTGNMTMVYSGSMTPVVGWNEFVFNENAFAWDGTSNILICVQRNNGTWNSAVYWQTHVPGFAAKTYQYSDDSAYNMASQTYSMTTSVSDRPNTIFKTVEEVGEVGQIPITLSFLGELENGSATISVPLNYSETAGNLKGFNLVGNPFVHNVISYGGSNVAEGCFRLNDVRDNLIVSEISEAHPLKPSEGFFVKATGENSSITFNAQTRSKTDRRGFINLELSSDGKLIDRLIVKNEGEPLEKLSLNENGTKLYAMQGRQEMAIVPCEGNEQAVDFKAAKNGTYTLSVEVENMELDYLHLIDNLTGTDINLLTTSSYTFTAKTTDYISRFRLVFNTNDSTSADSNTFAYYVDGEIRLAVETQNLASLQIVDAMGRVIRYTNAARHVSTSGLAPGLYVLRLIDGEIVKTQKIIIP